MLLRVLWLAALAAPTTATTTPPKKSTATKKQTKKTSRAPPSNHNGTDFSARHNTTNRFLVLTTQHSGSSWLAQELNAQPGVACKAELLVDMDQGRLHHDAKGHIKAPSWDAWVARAEAAFERVHREALKNTPGALLSAVGFKLMYSQIWDSRRPYINQSPKTWGKKPETKEQGVFPTRKITHVFIEK